MENTFTNFDRHANMDEETMNEILKLIVEIRDFDLTNYLYGMFDGYLYKDVPEMAKDLAPELAERVIAIYNICDSYPKIKTV